MQVRYGALLGMLCLCIGSYYIGIYRTTQLNSVDSVNKESIENQVHNCATGYESLMQEISLESLTLDGKIPTWISGSLYRNGPAVFEVGQDCCCFWHDGFAMVHRFAFANGNISYANKRVQTDYLAKSEQEDHFQALQKEKSRSFFSVFSSLFSKAPKYDNANINVYCIDNKLVVLPETPDALTLDPHSLTTQGAFRYDDTLSLHTCTAHPLYDEELGEWINVGIQFGKKSHYYVYRMNKRGKRTVIASIMSERPHYVHSFSMTQDYIIVTLMPFIINPMDLVTKAKPFLKHFTWKSELGTWFMVIDKKTGQEVMRSHTDAFFTFHHVNAWQDGQCINVDLVEYPDARIIDTMQLEVLKKGAHRSGTLCRYTIDMPSKRCTRKVLAEKTMESPRINENYKAKQYHFVYAVRSDNKALYKCDLETGKHLEWTGEHYLVGEPVFIARPESKKEDDGVIASVILDQRAHRSFLLLLDAITLKEVARAHLPHAIPMDFHGNFCVQ